MESKLWKLLLLAPDEVGADYLILKDDTDGSSGGVYV
jgi:hypothetical protein